MANRKVDDAIAILRKLAGSADHDVAMRANQTLAQAENFKAQSQTFALRVEEHNAELRAENTPENTPALRVSRDPGTSGSERVEVPIPMTVAPIPMPVHFVKGKLLSVDCSGSPQAVLTMSAGAKSLKLHVRDSGHVIVIGADQLSCDWKNKSLAVNYRERPTAKATWSRWRSNRAGNFQERCASNRYGKRTDSGLRRWMLLVYRSDFPAAYRCHSRRVRIHGRPHR